MTIRSPLFALFALLAMAGAAAAWQQPSSPPASAPAPPAAAAPARQTSGPPAPEATSLDRVRRGLARAGALTDALSASEEQGRPVFRLHIEGLERGDGLMIWDPAVDSAAPSYVRPKYPLYHAEYLNMTTPDAFRASTLHPMTFDVLGAIREISNGLRKARLAREEREERRRIREELAALKKELGLP